MMITGVDARGRGGLTGDGGPPPPSATRPSRGRRRRAKAIFWRVAEKLGALLILMAIVLVMTVFYPDFVTTSNLLTIGLQATTRAILAIGVTW